MKPTMIPELGPSLYQMFTNDNGEVHLSSWQAQETMSKVWEASQPGDGRFFFFRKPRIKMVASERSKKTKKKNGQHLTLPKENYFQMILGDDLFVEKDDVFVEGMDFGGDFS